MSRAVCSQASPSRPSRASSSGARASRWYRSASPCRRASPTGSCAACAAEVPQSSIRPSSAGTDASQRRAGSAPRRSLARVVRPALETVDGGLTAFELDVPAGQAEELGRRELQRAAVGALRTELELVLGEPTSKLVPGHRAWARRARYNNGSTVAPPPPCA